MESIEIKKQIADYLKSHNIMTLATVKQDGSPSARTLEYASDGATIYFATFNTSRKVQDFRQNPRVAYTVDEDYKDWMTIQGVKIEGIATILSNPEELAKAGQIFISKFPFVANFPPNLDLIFVKVEPIKGYFLDYTKGFTHTDEVMF